MNELPTRDNLVYDYGDVEQAARFLALLMEGHEGKRVVTDRPLHQRAQNCLRDITPEEMRNAVVIGLYCYQCDVPESKDSDRPIVFHELVDQMVESFRNWGNTLP